MQLKVTGIRSWLKAGLTAGVFALPLGAGVSLAGIASTSALTPEELRTALVSTHAAPDQGARRIQVGPRDTLWSLSRTHRPNSNITIKQAMLAIRDANPQAFPSGNINEMEAGSSLIIPAAAAMTRRTAIQAEEEVRRQNQQWVATKAPPVPERPRLRPVAPPQEPVRLQPQTVEPAARDLQLVTSAPADDTRQQRINELETQLAASEESLQSVEREKDDLAERITAMQQQVNTLQQLIRLKDDQLGDLERQLAARPVAEAAPAIPVAPAPLAEPDLAQDLFADIQRQPGLYGALGGSLLILLLVLFSLISTRRRLAEAEQLAQENVDSLESQLLAARNANSSDFDLDLNARPLDGLDDLDISNEFEDDLRDASLDLEGLDDLLTDTPETAVQKAAPAAAARDDKQRDPLQEAEMFIAYGRLEQAAGYLQTALAEHPEREDLRVKLLEVLVELNDEETFRQQRTELEARQASTNSRERAAELAGFFAAAGSVAAGAAIGSAAADDDLGELELDDDLGDLDLDKIFADDADPLHEPVRESLALPVEPDSSDIELDLSFDGDLADLDDLSSPLAELEETTDVVSADDDFADLLDLEADLDAAISSRDPLESEPEELLEEDLLDLEELNELDAADLALDPELEKPLAEDELLDAPALPADAFEPVDYKSDAEDFMSVLDSLSLDDVPVEEGDDEAAFPKQAPGIEEELAELSEDLYELQQLQEPAAVGQPAAEEEITLDLDELSDLGNLDELGDLSDLGDLDDLDVGSVNGDLNTQLDLATAYIEMGDQEGAREILEKVIREGDADTRATAQQMLEALAR